MGCTSSREKNMFANIDSILEKYTSIAKQNDLVLTTPDLDNEKDEYEYYQLPFRLHNKDKFLGPVDLRLKREKRAALPFPLYLIGWKFEKKLLAVGSAYTFKTMTEKLGVIQDIFIDEKQVQEKSLDLSAIQSLLVKALTTVVFEIEKVDQVRFDGDARLFFELTKSLENLKIVKAKYNELKKTVLLDHNPIPLQLNIFEQVGETVGSGISAVGDGMVSGVKFVGSGVKMVGTGVVTGVSLVGNGVVTGVTAVGTGVVTAGKFVGNTVGSAASKVGDAIIPGKKEEEKARELEEMKDEGDERKQEEKARRLEGSPEKDDEEEPVKHVEEHTKHEEEPVKHEETHVKHEATHVKHEEEKVKHEEENVKHEEEPVRQEEQPVKYEENPEKHEGKEERQPEIKDLGIEGGQEGLIVETNPVQGETN